MRGSGEAGGGGRKLWTFAVWLPVVLAVAVRIAVLPRVWEPPEFWLGDAASYLRIAQDLAKGAFAPDAWLYSPGYPCVGALLAPLGGQAWGLVAASFLSGVLVAALALLAGRLAGRPACGFVASVVLACHPDLALAGVRPLSEATALAALLAAGLALEVGRRTGRTGLAAAGGIFAGLAALTRPENALATNALGLWAIVRRAQVGSRARRAGVVFLAASLLVVLPYVAALHAASGVWALSLKPYLLLREAYRDAPSYAEGRARWEKYFQRFEEGGRLDLRALTRSVSVTDRLRHADLAGEWTRNVAAAAGEAPPALYALWILGFMGLVWPARESGRERMIPLLMSSPALVVPLVCPPSGRFAVAAIPALAWGTGLVFERAIKALGKRSRKAPAGVAALVVSAALVWSGTALRPVVRDIHWVGRCHEIEVRVHLGESVEAEALARQGIAIDPSDARFVNALGFVVESRGHLAAAERAYREAVNMGGDPRGLVGLLRRTGREEEARKLESADRTSARSSRD